eukprot:CAMPEP_0202688422 /NCGR_PEP_ID=MMETSP1385-20130828/3938_1 /ASSEMBLY_ACC=CAM_ASM_000861 /TAXON_ID=933848 /ORGANISM="Elphidium margaritaceum" /LENGTH=453 /DNA_ID=CAMNT_0049343399 /DNA_START=18 /DNA_END=1379 /DNA_ORIENTATION=+
MADSNSTLHSTTDTTTKWLHDHNLIDIVAHCKTHGITLQLLKVADLNDFRDLCKDAGISTPLMLRLKDAVMSLADSVIAKQAFNAAHNVMVIGEEEKDVVDALDGIMQQNASSETALTEMQKTATEAVNTSIDELMQLVLFKRQTLLQQIDAVVAEQNAELKQQNLRAVQLKLNVLQNDADGMSDAQEFITQTEQSHAQSIGSCAIAVNIDLNRLDGAIAKYCGLRVSGVGLRLGAPSSANEAAAPTSLYEVCKLVCDPHSLLTSLNDDATVCYKKKLVYTVRGNVPKALSQKHAWVSIDMKPIRSGVHCFRVKIRGRNGFLWLGVRSNANKNIHDLDDYNDVRTFCGGNIFSWYRSDADEETHYVDMFAEDAKDSRADWDLLLTLTAKEQSLKIKRVDDTANRELVIPIQTLDTAWTPHAILFAGGNNDKAYSASNVRMHRLRTECYGQSVQ